MVCADGAMPAAPWFFISTFATTAAVVAAFCRVLLLGDRWFEISRKAIFFFRSFSRFCLDKIYVLFLSRGRFDASVEEIVKFCSLCLNNLLGNWVSIVKIMSLNRGY